VLRNSRLMHMDDRHKAEQYFPGSGGPGIPSSRSSYLERAFGLPVCANPRRGNQPPTLNCISNSVPTSTAPHRI
jgi:hypothetical protein